MSDLISRDDVYGVLKKVNIREMPIYVFDKLWNGIRDLPSIEPEERMTKVEHKSDIYVKWEECGNCHAIGMYHGWNYCPKCGVKLDWNENE